MNNPTLENLLNRTPAGRAILSKLSGADDYPELLGAARRRFMPGLKKAVKAIGKRTSKITGAIAKTAAAAVGIPPSAIDALARVDPTAHKALVKTITAKPAPAGPGAIDKLKKMKISPAVLAIGGAGLLGIILLSTKRR